MVVAICESKKCDVELMKHMVEEFFGRRKLRGQICVYKDGAGLLQAAATVVFDIVLLEISLPDVNGLSVSRTLRRRNPYVSIIFVSGSKRFAWEAFCIGAVHYVIKPIEKRWIEEALERCRRTICIEERKNGVEIIVDREHIIVHQDCIRYIESQEKQLYIHTAFGEYRIWKAIGSMEKELDEERFVKLQRSYIAHMDYIAGFQGESCTLKDGKIIGTSRKYRAIIREKHRNYLKLSAEKRWFCF